MAPLRVIINADDFGFSRGITDGILRSHREGVLTSTTLMTTMPDCDRAIDLAGEARTLGVGIHLSLTQGKPQTGCRRILSREGEFFRSLPRLFVKLRSQAARKEARDEMAAQILYARKRGLMPTHVDSHKHVCHLPALHGALIEACGATGILWMRTAREIRVEHVARAGLAYRVLARYAEQLAKRAKEAGMGTTDWFFGLATTGRTDVKVFEALAAALRERGGPEGWGRTLGEVMVHPGWKEGITERETRLLGERVREMEALCDGRTRGALEAAGVRLVRFGDGEV